MQTRQPVSASLFSACDGVVFLEFILAFVPVFLLSLGILQLALLAVASLVVQHAAIAGARSASVVLDDDPRYYREAQRGDISSAIANIDDGSASLIASRLGKKGKTASVYPLGGPRVAAIRQAVHVPLSAIAPEPALLAPMVLPALDTNVEQVLGTTPTARLLFGLTYYVPATTAVTFPKSPGSTELFVDHLGPSTEVTVRVTHMVPCLVPVVSALMCKELDAAADDERARAELRFAPGAAVQAAFGKTRVALMQAEATMPLQSATYLYESQFPGGGS